MAAATLPQIRMRSKHQFTLPARIVREANIQADDRLTVTYTNGRIILVPVQSRIVAKDDVMSYAGMFRGAWGSTAAQADQTLNQLHNEWEA
jgi:bifunctional DNA-binding transcriptional regulator/antitoxin component of YhaV-PrlF toxin-antitoxin module